MSSNEPGLGGLPLDGWTEAVRLKGWRVLVRLGDDGEPAAYQIVNPDENGVRQFYRLVSGQYGEPLMELEPDLSLELPWGLTYVDPCGAAVELQERLAGILVKEFPRQAAPVVARFSLTNARRQGIELQVSDDGVLTLNGETYYLYALVWADKNRVRNLNGFFSKVPPRSSEVVVYELQDLV